MKRRIFTPHAPGAAERLEEIKMTTSSTQLGYLDLEAFYMQAKNVREIGSTSLILSCASVRDICDKLMSVIDAIRADGLDPRWNPDGDTVVAIRDALLDYNNYYGSGSARAVLDGLRERGYKIVKDEAA